MTTHLGTRAHPGPGRPDPDVHIPHIKPRARGWIHVVAAEVVLVAGTALVAVSWAMAGTIAGLSTLTYALAVLGMFTVSAFYHRITWTSVIKRLRMRRLDHSMIFVLIAGTYTPFALLTMTRRTGMVALAIVWGGALAGILVKVFWPTSPRWIGVTLYLLLGWVALFYIAAILDGAGVVVVTLLAAGGVLYSIGGLLYALRRPDPWPGTFGYHEFFHAATALAAACHYIAVWLAVF